VTPTVTAPAPQQRPPRIERRSDSHKRVVTHSVSPAPPGGAVDESVAATWRADLGAGLVVFLVALPLCLGIALASGAPLFSGIITGVVGGLVVSRLSGSQLMVSGPAAGLGAIVLAAITDLGSFEVFLVAVVLAGVVQLVLGAVKAGIIGYFFPSSVIRGMLAGIGLILILKQLPYALGVGVEVFESDSFAQPGGNTFTAIVDAAAAAVPAAMALSAVALLILAFWGRVPGRARKLCPAPLVAVLVGVVANAALAAFWPALALPREALVTLPTVASLTDVAALFTFPDWSALGDPRIYRIALTIGFVASLETLLSLEATDKLDPYKRNSPANRELLAQGTGNVLAGLVGGLPMTGVIVRSAANIGAGGRTWRASFIHGAFLTVAVLSIPGLLNRIPLAVLAAILIHTGYKLAHPRNFRDAWKVGPKYLLPFVLTIVAILATDLLVGICAGLAIGTFFILRDSYRNAYSYDRRESPDHSHVRLVLAEEVTFLNRPQISDALNRVPRGGTLTVDGSRSKHIDYDVIDLLHDFRDRARSKGITLRLVDIPDPLLEPSAH